MITFADMLAIFGLCLLGYGLYMWSIPLALCVVGSILIVMALAIAYQSKRGAP